MPEFTPTEVAIAAFVPTIAAPAATFAWNWLKDRRDRSKEKDQESQVAQGKVRSDLDAQTLALLTEQRTLNDRLASQLKQVEKDRDRGWNLARYYFNELFNLYHTLMTALFLANTRLAAANLPQVDIPKIILPNSLEEPATPDQKQ